MHIFHLGVLGDIYSLYALYFSFLYKFKVTKLRNKRKRLSAPFAPVTLTVTFCNFRNFDCNFEASKLQKVTVKVTAFPNV